MSTRFNENLSAETKFSKTIRYSTEIVSVLFSVEGVKQVNPIAFVQLPDVNSVMRRPLPGFCYDSAIRIGISLLTRCPCGILPMCCFPQQKSAYLFVFYKPLNLFCTRVNCSELSLSEKCFFFQKHYLQMTHAGIKTQEISSFIKST